jgi:glycosyltransferase involved in cell wall biosynthesis
MISLIANEEYFLEPSGGGNDIYSDFYLLRSLGLSSRIITISEIGEKKELNSKRLLVDKDFKNDVLFFSGFISAERFSKQVPLPQLKNKKIINIKDVHFFRELRSEMLLVKKSNHQNVMTRELKIYSSCDLILCYNLKEMTLLKKLLPSNQFQMHTYFDANFISNSTFKKNNRLLFAGNFNHLPNLDGVNKLILDLKGFIENKNTNLDIYGPESINKLSEFSDLSWIRLCGTVPNKEDIYKDGGIFISPIRFGSGIKIKLIEAALSSLPIIATPESVEGMPLENLNSVLLYKSKNELHHHLETLLINDFLQQQLADSAFQEMQMFSNEAIAIKNLAEGLASINITNYL